MIVEGFVLKRNLSWESFWARIKSLFLNRELWLYAPIYFFLSWISLSGKLFTTGAWFDGTLVRNQNLLLNLSYTNNEQSRLLQFLVPETFHRMLGLSIEHAYILQRLLFVFLAFLCFHFYMRKWFTPEQSFSGVLFLAAVMPLSNYNDLQESAPLLLLTFIVGLWAIRENNVPVMLLDFLIGGLNNESMLILPLAYFLYRWKSSERDDVLLLCAKTFLISLPLLLTIGPIRYITRYRPHLGGAWHLPDNLAGVWKALHLNVLDMFRERYLFIFFIFNILLIYAFIRYREKPLFMRRIVWIIPPFIIAHFLTGIILEVRQMVPLAFIIIPMALFTLYPSRMERLPPEPPKKHSKPTHYKFSLWLLLALTVVSGLVSAYIHAPDGISGLPWHVAYSDLVPFYQKAIEPGLPYINKPVEYPVLVGSFVQSMGIIGRTALGYYFFSVTFFILFAAIITYVLRKMLPRKDSLRLVVYWIFAPSLLVFLTYNWDILAVFFSVLGLYCMHKNRDMLAAVSLALGFASKFYPVLYVLPLMLRQKTWKSGLKIAGVFGAVVALINIPFAIANFKNWSRFFSFSAGRGPNPDSIWAVIRSFLPHLTDNTITWISGLLFVAGLIFLLIRFRQKSETIRLCFALTLLFLLVNKIFSPQFTLWLLPFFVLVPLIEKRWFYAVEVCNIIVLFSILSWYFAPNKSDMHIHLSNFFVILRQIALIMIFAKITTTQPYERGISLFSGLTKKH